MKRLMIVTASATVLASAAFAQSTDDMATAPQYTPQAMAEENVALDALSVTTKEEAKAFAKAEFAMIDVNGDAKIEKSEFLAAAAAAHATAESALNDTVGAAQDTVADAENAIESATDLPATMTAEASVDAEGQIAEGDTDVETAEQQFIGLSQNKETVSEKQFIEARVADFKAADVNSDGKLEAAEQESFAKSVKFGAVL